MKTLRKIQSLTTCLALIGLLIPIQPAAAQRPNGRAATTRTPLIRDVALGTGGKLSGVVVDESGKPTSKPIAVTTQTGKLAGRGASSADGRFVLSGENQPSAQNHVRLFAAVTDRLDFNQFICPCQ